MNITTFIGLLCIALGHSAGHADSYAQMLQRETRLRPGYYRRAPGTPRRCLSGRLSLEDVGPGAVSIFFEDTVLIDAIGPGSNGPAIKAHDEGPCPNQRPPGVIRANHLDGTKTQKCEHQNFTSTWVYSIDITDKGLTYQLDRSGDKETCVLIGPSTR